MECVGDGKMTLKNKISKNLYYASLNFFVASGCFAAISYIWRIFHACLFGACFMAFVSDSYAGFPATHILLILSIIFFIFGWVIKR